MSVFVHGGAGALGQAVISVALGHGCKVYTTVSDVKKKRFLQKIFSELTEKQIGYSRDHTFGDMVLSGTNGFGCDIVISCVNGDLKNVCLKSTASYGVTLDLTQISNQDNFYYKMFNMTKNRSYSAIDFRQAIIQLDTNILKKLQVLVSEGIKRGHVRPLSRMVFSPLEVSRAFRLIATCRHRGRVLIQLRTQGEKVFAQQIELRLDCLANSSHLILCNDDYLGLRIAERLVKRGARKIYLHGLKQSAYVEYEIQHLQNVGAEVKICNADFKSENDITTIINNSIGLGPVEGVYFIDKDEPSFSGFKVIKTLDLITRKLCPHLRYFGIIGSNANNYLNTCITRYQDKLPVTNVILPPIEKMGTTPTARKGLISEPDAINLFEKALKSNEPVLLANVNSKKCQSVVNELTQFEEVKSSDELMGTATLSEEDIPSLTIHSVRDIQTDMFDLEHKSTKGLSTFYSRIDPDELLATTDMVFLPTLVNNSQMRDDEFDPTQTYLCIIPGLEGHHGRFHALCEGLKLPVIVLQPGLDLPDESVTDLAKRYAGILLKKTALKKSFYLMGYESGALVALEVAAVLEEQGLTGTVFCIGESPDNFHITLKKELEDYDSDEALQIAVANHMVNLMLGENTIGLKKELTVAETWPEKIEKCVSLILGKVSHSAQYARELIGCAYGRIRQIQAYRPTPKALQSKLILINSATSTASFKHSLQSYSQTPVTIYQLTTPLAYCAADLRCTSIINSHLDVTLLKDFEKKNLCDTYLLNGDTFQDFDSNDA